MNLFPHTKKKFSGRPAPKEKARIDSAITGFSKLFITLSVAVVLLQSGTANMAILL